MPMSTYKPLNTETAIGAALSSVNGSPLVRVINTGATANVLHVCSNSTGTTEYANLTIGAGAEIILKKLPTDYIQGNSMLATNMAYLY